MNISEFLAIQNRRRFLRQCAAGMGTFALAQLLARDGYTAGREAPEDPLQPRPPHFPPTAENVIFLFMAGAPSQLDLLDPKPELQRRHGQPLPPSMQQELVDDFKKNAQLMGSPRTFNRHGKCGMEISDFLPHFAGCADDVCLVRSMHTTVTNHHPGQLLMNCGTILVGHPSMGSWVTYGLGSESQNLPGFVVLTSSSGLGVEGGASNWSSGFLSSNYRGVVFRSSGEPVLHVGSPAGVSEATQRARLDAVGDLNRLHQLQTGDLEIAARIQSYELAFRMQTAVPELADLSGESAATRQMYGIDQETTRPFGMNCLLARRLVERGVRFVQLYHSSWDDHKDLEKNLKKNCEMTDKPMAALLKDLKQRGLLEKTLVVWGGEFGRSPMTEVRLAAAESGREGRDHHAQAFSMWMAGGGVRGGQVVGRTDDLGFNVLEDKIHIHDLQATILHCLGLDHRRLTFRHMGRDFRLTDVGGQVVQKLLL